MNRKHRLPMALALALVSGQALALGLGQVEVKSALYEPLVAEIPVLSSTPGEAESLTVRLASPDAFARVGLDRPPSLAANLEFSVGENARGQRVIRITTRNRVNDPFLSFLVEADWGRGRLIREFNLLLDPPNTVPAARTAAAAPVREAPATRPEPLEAPPPMPAPVATPSPAEASGRPAQASAQPAEPAQPPPGLPAPAPAGGDYAVAAGDTLWSIAQRTRPDAGVSVNRMMAALLQANPDAFIDGNINRIKRGAVLRIPDQAVLQDTSEAQAGALVREQMDAWRAERVPSLLPAEARPGAVATPPQRAPQADSRLELVPPRGDRPAQDARSGMAPSEGGSELRAELARAREEVSTRDQEIAELRSRVQELEQLRNDSQRLISMKDSELAALQRRLAEIEAEQAAPGAPTGAAAGAGEAAGQADGADASLAANEAAAPAGDPAQADAPPAASDTQAVVVPPPVEGTTDAADVPARDPVPAAEPAAGAAAEPMPERGAEPLFRSPWVLGGIGLIVVGLLAWLLSRRRRDPEDAAPRSATGGGVLAAALPSRDRDEHAADAAADPTTAREAALLDALAERPEDLERHLALTRFYYEQGDADAFEGAAEAMYAQVYDPDNLMWKQVLAMGRELLPDHPLFATHAEPLHGTSGDGAADVDEATLAAGASLDQRWDQGTEADDFSAASLQPSAGDHVHYAADVDDGFADERADTPAQPTPVAPEPALHAEPAWDAPDEATTQRFHVDDFADAGQQDTFGSDADADAGAGAAAAQQTSYEAPRGEPSGFEYGADDAAATKLELARAYLDMGDVEGARGMLEEVMGEGNAGQRAEARRLLDEIR